MSVVKEIMESSFILDLPQKCDICVKAGMDRHDNSMHIRVGGQFISPANFTYCGHHVYPVSDLPHDVARVPGLVAKSFDETAYMMQFSKLRFCELCVEYWLKSLLGEALCGGSGDITDSGKKLLTAMVSFVSHFRGGKKE